MGDLSLFLLAFIELLIERFSYNSVHNIMSSCIRRCFTKENDLFSPTARSSKPWTAFGRGVQDVLQWQKMAETLVVFLVSAMLPLFIYLSSLSLPPPSLPPSLPSSSQIYMYCVWNGWIMQVVAFIAIIKLSMNYLYTR